MKKGNGILLILLCLMLTAGSAFAETYVENGGRIPDTTVYQGDWKDAYLRVLAKHSPGIARYEARTIEYISNGRQVSARCRPIALEDLTQDGVPELIFMEADAAESRGDLYIYSWNRNQAACVLYVPGITRLDYDELLGFRIYCSGYGGDTLVIEHYEYEWPWVLQFTRNALNQYTLAVYLHAEYDSSGEGDDRYIRNGSQISWEEYESTLAGIQNGRTRTISDYMAADLKTYGFTHTRSSAGAELQGKSQGSSGSQGKNSSGSQGKNRTGDAIYGYTIKKLATRNGPSTIYEDTGTYNVKNQWIRVLARAWDDRNGIWWVKCEIPYHGEIRVLWTGYKRFDPKSLSLEDIPEEDWW